jgi:NADPH-dependent 7-cyano-7-deazaguanine reductase QueF-like protein
MNNSFFTIGVKSLYLESFNLYPNHFNSYIEAKEYIEKELNDCLCDKMKIFLVSEYTEEDYDKSR